jgi:glycosyltransferase involved in cell wall biosynthesis
MELSIVIPVYNEEENVQPLIGEVESALAPLRRIYEIIAVDDGSKDRTFIALRQLQRCSPRLKIVRLKRNFGQTAAMAAGLAYAQGDIIVLMDGDGQNDPADIPALITKIEEANDLVAGWRVNRQDPFFSRRLPSMIANRLISWTTKVKLHDYGCTLKAMRKDVAKNLRLYGEMHRFIPAIAYERGAQIAEIKVNHRPRLRGKSKYGITRTLRVVLDLLTVKFLISYSTRPSHIFGPLGVVSGGIGFLLGVYLTVDKFYYGALIGGRPLLLLAVLLIFLGFQFLTMGLLGEMLARTYHESQDRPIYVVGEVVKQGGTS